MHRSTAVVALSLLIKTVTSEKHSWREIKIRKLPSDTREDWCT